MAYSFDEEFKNSILIDGVTFYYKVIASRRKTVTAKILPDKKLIVKIPFGYSKKMLEDCLSKKARLIIKYLFQARKREERKAALSDCYKSGGVLFYLGKGYRLVIDDGGQDDVVVTASEIILHSKKRLDEVETREVIEAWYLREAERLFIDRLREMVKRFEDMDMPLLRLKWMKTQWGSYRRHLVVLNLHLIKVPLECIDYIILHELCHAYEANHQKKFYEILSSKLENWKEVNDKLETFAKQFIAI